MNTAAQALTPVQAMQTMALRLGIDHLPHDEQDTIIRGVVDVSMQEAMTVILGNLTEADLKRFDSFIDSGEVESAQALVNKNVPQAAKVIDDALTFGIEEYKKIAAEENKKA
jgi:hypothetical protein